MKSSASSRTQTKRARERSLTLKLDMDTARKVVRMAVTLQQLATSVQHRVAWARPPSALFLPSLTVRANQWPGLVLVISHSQVPEVARVVARRTQQHKRGRLKLNLLLLLTAHLPCLPCLLYFIRCSGVTSNPAHVEVHSICGDLRLPPPHVRGLVWKVLRV